MPVSRNKTVGEQVETLYDAVPASGEIEYTALYDVMVTTGNKDALNHLQSLKHQGRLKVRTDYNPDTSKTTVFVSRA